MTVGSGILAAKPAEAGVYCIVSAFNGTFNGLDTMAPVGSFLVGLAFGAGAGSAITADAVTSIVQGNGIIPLRVLEGLIGVGLVALDADGTLPSDQIALELIKENPKLDVQSAKNLADLIKIKANSEVAQSTQAGKKIAYISLTPSEITKNLGANIGSFTNIDDRGQVV